MVRRIHKRISLFYNILYYYIENIAKAERPFIYYNIIYFIAIKYRLG